MSLTVQNIITNLNSYIGDSSTDRITAAERLEYVTEGTLWVQEELGNDLQNATYTLPYFDTVHYYKTTSSITDLLEGADLRRAEADQNYSFAHKSARELAEEIGQNFSESSWAVERRDSNTYLVVNHQSKFDSALIFGADSTTENGTWAVDSVNSDANNLTIDTYEFKTGSASFNFDITVAQSGNNRATLKNTTITSLDLSQYENLASWIFWIYVPTVTYFSGITLYWGSSASAYWSATVTTDIDGAAWVVGWNRVKINWVDATKTSTPTVSSIAYMQVDYNYTASQTNATDYRLDDIRICRPENLTFHYLSWNVGTSTGGTDITKFSATTDIPYFSGQYDQYKYAVAHKAASLAFQNLRLIPEGQYEAAEAEKALDRARTFIASSKNPETKSFKVRGVTFTKNRRVRRG